MRASGFGFVYGIPNLGKFIGPGLAVIIGASNYVSPKATLAGIVPGFNYFAVWYACSRYHTFAKSLSPQSFAVAPRSEVGVAYLLIGIETRGRTFEELDATIARPKPLAARPG